MTNTIALLLILMYLLFLIVGTVFLVQYYNWSPWWFALTVIFCGITLKTKEGDK